MEEKMQTKSGLAKYKYMQSVLFCLLTTFIRLYRENEARACYKNNDFHSESEEKISKSPCTEKDRQTDRERESNTILKKKSLVCLIKWSHDKKRQWGSHHLHSTGNQFFRLCLPCGTAVAEYLLGFRR